ncbi:MAG: glycosyltransferase family 39 protein [Thermodesulfobacteriota bacterium]|nr:glycosyltransferase family 39 protein [Thermodesulfobacteriota bacterium]
MSNSKRKEIFILLLCLLIGFALRLYTFDQKSLWIDEVHTFNDSRDGMIEQIKFYKENPAYLHPPLFFILTHLFYPFPKPERDLRIIPLIFGILSIPMFYLLAKSFSPGIALPCTLSLTFMTYHISLSQDGRSYSLLMFLGMTGLYFFLKHLKTSKNRYLILVALLFAVLFHTSYSSIPFIALSQILWFYLPNEESKKPTLSSFLTLNGLILLFCLPWILFVVANYKGQPIMDPLHGDPGSFFNIFSGVILDWVLHLPLMIISIILLILFPFFTKYKKNALILLTVFILPIGGLYLYCKLLNITHFVTSRYFVNFLPLFFITIFISLDAIEMRFERLRKLLRLKLAFLIFLIASNLIILPHYYSSEKQDFRGLANYLKGQLREGDKIFVQSIAYIPGILHYFRIIPKGRHYFIPFELKDSRTQIEFKKPFLFENKTYTIYSSNICCDHYVADGNRLWIVYGKPSAQEFKKNSPSVLKGYFDGSFASFRRFPSDASMYLFLLDPKSPDEKGIDMPIE